MNGIVGKNIPEISSLDNAIRIYYRYPEIGTKEIKELFGSRSNGTIVKLKKLARGVMIEEKIPTCRTSSVNTNAAFQAWGIDVVDLEKRREKLNKLGIS